MSSGVGLDDGLLVCTLLLLIWPELKLIMSMGRAFTLPKSTPPPHIQKVSGSIPPGSSPVLLFLLAVGFLLLLLLLLVLVVAAVAVAFGGASRHAAGNGVSASGARAIECCCCFWRCFWPCCLQSQPQERPAGLAGG